MSEEKDRVTDAKEERQKTLDKLGGDSQAKTYKPVDKEKSDKSEER
jgi:hypothetical protein